MKIAYYMNHHVPAAITQGLRILGIDVLTAYEDEAADWDDEKLLERATSLGRILFTEDRDFLVITRNWLDSRHEFSGIVFTNQIRITIGQAIRDLELIAKVFDLDEMRNRIEFIPYE